VRTSNENARETFHTREKILRLCVEKLSKDNGKVLRFPTLENEVASFVLFSLIIFISVMRENFQHKNITHVVFKGRRKITMNDVMQFYLICVWEFDSRTRFVAASCVDWLQQRSGLMACCSKMMRKNVEKLLKKFYW
jgi:hypothetical protein